VRREEEIRYRTVTKGASFHSRCSWAERRLRGGDCKGRWEKMDGTIARVRVLGTTKKEEDFKKTGNNMMEFPLCYSPLPSKVKA